MRAMACATNDSEAIVEALLTAGADPHLRDERSAGMIRCASESGTQRKLELLRQAGSSWTEADAGRSLERATRAGRTKVVRALLDLQPTQASRIPALCSVVGSVVGTDQAELLELLLEGGLPLDHRCGDGRTALMTAAQSDRGEARRSRSC